MTKSQKAELKVLAPLLSDKQKETVRLASAGIPFDKAMRKAGYTPEMVSKVRHNKVRSEPLQKLKKLFDNSYAKVSRQINLSGERCARTINAVLDDVKSRPFDKLMAVKEHHRIISGVNSFNPNNTPINLQAKNVLILGSQSSIDDFNKQTGKDV